MEQLSHALVVGAVATLTMDLWGLVRQRLFGVAPPNYGLVGRWVAHMAHGQFLHRSSAASPPVPGELVLGWVVHYLTGIAFAALLLAAWGGDWLRQPTLGPALVVGFGTVLAPFLVMQPGMGAGIAASRTPRPAAARLQSLVTHGIFGLGLFAGGWLARVLQASA
jgi:Protein of unknown function (DUF2938)